MRYRDDEGHVTNGLKLAAVGFGGVVTVAICVLVWGLLDTRRQVVEVQRQILSTDAPPTDLMGWAGKKEFEKVAAQLEAATPKFKIIGDARDNSKKVVKLWEAEKAILGGLIPTFQQQIGDCVAAGAKQAAERLHCGQQLARPPPEGASYQAIFAPYHYGTGRNASECGNGRIRGPDGSIGGWQALALQKYGVISTDAEAEDGETLPEYSAAVARKWAVKMPAAKWVKIGKQYPIKTIARVKTADQIRDAICSGYPVTIASDWGGAMAPTMENGKLVNRKTGVWNHQMCCVGVDGESPGGPYWFVLNSWGPKAHGTPTDGSPPGGFWIRKKDMDYIAKQDCWALSDAEGFPARDWQFFEGLPVGWKAKPEDAQRAAMLQGEVVPICMSLCFALAP